MWNIHTFWKHLLPEMGKCDKVTKEIFEYQDLSVKKLTTISGLWATIPDPLQSVSGFADDGREIRYRYDCKTSTAQGRFCFHRTNIRQRSGTWNLRRERKGEKKTISILRRQEHWSYAVKAKRSGKPCTKQEVTGEKGNFSHSWKKFSRKSRRGKGNAYV